MEFTVSWKSIFRVIIAAVAVYLAFKLLKVIFIIAIALMLSSALFPISNKLKKIMPGPLAAIFVVFVLISPIIILALNILPNLFEQFPAILATVNHIINKSAILPPSIRNINLTQYSSSIASYLLHSTSLITNFLTTLITIIFLTLYFLIDSKRLKNILYDLIPDGHNKKARNLAEELTQINGHYIRGNIFISIICGLIIFAGLYFLKVPYAGSLALFAAITDLLPLIGAFLGAAPAVIIGFSISPTIGILTLALFIIYQQVENNLLSPNIYTKALDLSPALIFVAVIVGAALFGMFGAFIALPIAAGIPTIAKFAKSENLET